MLGIEMQLRRGVRNGAARDRNNWIIKLAAFKGFAKAATVMTSPAWRSS